jgi:hypothetical protein
VSHRLFHQANTYLRACVPHSDKPLSSAQADLAAHSSISPQEGLLSHFELLVTLAASCRGSYTPSARRQRDAS